MNMHLPIQKCLNGHEVSSLSDIELIAVILGTGNKGNPVIELAAQIFSRFGGLYGIFDSGLRELSGVNGVGRTKAVRLLASLEAGRRIINAASPSTMCDSPLAAWKAVITDLACSKREEFRVLVLDNKNRILRNSCTSVGTVSETIIHPREVFRDAIREAGSSIILAHNHPSGVLTPSREDIDVTKRLSEVGRIVGIALLDHIIVSNSGYLSMKEEGYL